jgi:hypothetical protein
MGERIEISKKEIRGLRSKRCDSIYETIRELDKKQVESYARAYEVVVTNDTRKGLISSISV